MEGGPSWGWACLCCDSLIEVQLVGLLFVLVGGRGVNRAIDALGDT
jgi:hypothetical protein